MRTHLNSAWNTDRSLRMVIIMVTSSRSGNKACKAQDERLTSGKTRGNMTTVTQPVNLENGINALPPVQANREFDTASGCHVSLSFKEEHNPGIRREIESFF